MTRLSRGAWTLSLAAGLIVLGGFAASSGNAATAHRNGVAAVTIGGVAAQLGVKVQGEVEGEFVVGSSFTGTLQEPEKLAALGIRNMQTGARVTAMRIAPDRVYVEADQEPAPTRGSARLRVDSDGNLSKSP